MTFSTHGEGIFQVEISNVDSHGLWLLLGDKEYFLSYAEFPWFRKATLEQIINVEVLHGHHLHWPELDVDLCLESLVAPESFPLIYE